MARERRDEARKLIADGVDPSAQRKAEKIATGETVELITREWLASLTRQPETLKDANRRRGRNGPLDVKTVARMTKRFETFVFPALGYRPIRRITAPELLTVLRRIEARGTHETAHRVRAACSRGSLQQRQLGHSGEDQTGHGFRGMRRTIKRNDR